MSRQAAIPHPRRLNPSPALARALAAFLGLHGIAHLAGTSDSFSKAADGGSVDYLAGAWTLSDPALLRAVGVVWALVGAAFVFAAAVTWMRRPQWPRVLAAVSVVSLVVVVIALWSSMVGVVIDVALLALAVRAGAVRAGGFSRAGARR